VALSGGLHGPESDGGGEEWPHSGFTLKAGPTDRTGKEVKRAFKDERDSG